MGSRDWAEIAPTDSSQAMALQPSTRLGHYEVLRPLGAGGMGEVYRAHDTRLDRDIALKVLPEAYGAKKRPRADEMRRGPSSGRALEQRSVRRCRILCSSSSSQWPGG